MQIAHELALGAELPLHLQEMADLSARRRLAL
jgi:hypothetical protein